MKDGSNEALEAVLSNMEKLTTNYPVKVQYKDLGYFTYTPNRVSVPTVGNTLKNMIFGSGPRHRLDILKGATGRILPGRFTLILGPPGSGKSVFMKALSGRLLTGSTMGTMTGEVNFNGQCPGSNTFLLQKVADYIEQGDNHCATLTVEETLEFAWKAATGGHHSYGLAKNDECARVLNEGDASLEWVSCVR
jgi:ABC-type multidrug transport system ATPase subunit